MKYGPNVWCYLHLIPRQDFLDVRDPDIYVYIDDPSINMRLKWGLFMSDWCCLLSIFSTFGSFRERSEFL